MLQLEDVSRKKGGNSRTLRTGFLEEEEDRYGSFEEQQRRTTKNSTELKSSNEEGSNINGSRASHVRVKR